MLDVHRAPGRIRVVQRGQTLLHVCPGAQLLGRADQHPHLAIIGVLEEAGPRLTLRFVGRVTDSEAVTGVVVEAHCHLLHTLRLKAMAISVALAHLLADTYDGLNFGSVPSQLLTERIRSRTGR